MRYLYEILVFGCDEIFIRDGLSKVYQNTRVAKQAMNEMQICEKGKWAGKQKFRLALQKIEPYFQSKVLDRVQFETLFDASDPNSFDFFSEIMQVFVEDFTEMIHEISAIYEEKSLLRNSNDAEELRFHLHKIRGCCVTLGAQQVSRAVESMREHLIAMNPEQLKSNGSGSLCDLTNSSQAVIECIQTLVVYLKS
mmetsp:Transcript_21839/g.30376  ORF Transcript_21839/g.30376 Transcript_21839/m.30376 type:complete len:195 (+) Transcript_21839:84-668(+)